MSWRWPCLAPAPRRSEVQAAALQHKLDALLALERKLAVRDRVPQSKR
ncbi:MAG: hypothetical protein ACK59Y_03885 [Betaproteobacteria bacterium]|nr:hypothetical protein [Betaproteobacteria bacterium]